MELDNPFDLEAQANAQQQKRARLEFEQKLKTEDIQWLMSGKRGRRIMYRLLAFTGAHHSPYTGDRDKTHVHIGMQNVGLMLEQWILEACPDMYGVMRAEHLRDQNGGQPSSNAGSVGE